MTSHFRDPFLPFLCAEELFLSGGPISSAEVCMVVVHDIKEVEGERQQEVQEDKGDEEIGDEVNGEVEESHSTCA